MNPVDIYIYIYMLHRPLYEYNNAESSLLLPAVAPILVVDCRSLSIPIKSPSVPPWGRHPVCARAGPHLTHCIAKMWLSLCQCSTRVGYIYRIYIHISVTLAMNPVQCGGYSGIRVGAPPSELRQSRPEQQKTSSGSMKLMVVRIVQHIMAIILA